MSCFVSVAILRPRSPARDVVGSPLGFLRGGCSADRVARALWRCSRLDRRGLRMTAPTAARAGARARRQIVRHALSIGFPLDHRRVCAHAARDRVPADRRRGVRLVTPHWITGVVLIAAVLFHVVRGLFWQSLRTVWIGGADVRDALAIVRSTLRMSTAPAKPGKYSFAQKLIHAAFAIVLTVSVTGAFMLARMIRRGGGRIPYLSRQDLGCRVRSARSRGLVVDHDGDDARLLRVASREAVVHTCDDPRLDYARGIWRASDPNRWQVDR